VGTTRRCLNDDRNAGESLRRFATKSAKSGLPIPLPVPEKLDVEWHRTKTGASSCQLLPLVSRRCPLNVQFLWELEEEIGSPHFADFVAQPARLSLQFGRVSDTVWLSRTTPAVPMATRDADHAARLETGSNDCHSGLTGAAARNPLGELCDLIGSAMTRAQAGPYPRFLC